MDLNNPLFHTYFKTVYEDRWEKIYAGLVTKGTTIYRSNKFADFSKFDFSKLKLFANFQNSYSCDDNLSEVKDSNNMNLFYKMDPASQIVAESLKVHSEQKVLDMCAAPGGKSLILCEALAGTGELILNEVSKDRRERLNRVIHQYIPYDFRKNTFVKGLDGNQYGLRSVNYFNAVLCDVPCSGERHLLENEKEFKNWTINRSKNLSVRQYSLLSSAWLSCQLGGKIVYSTCSISKLENDEVVKKLIKRRAVEVQRIEALEKYQFIEKTEFGYQILPDIAGFGPMFFSILLKV